MSKGKITDKQREILEYIRDTILAKGYPPAVREICEAVHLKSTSSVHSHLETLEKNGYIRRDPTKPRTIEILDDDFALTRREMVNVPVVGTVAAGQPILAEENIEDYIKLDKDIPADFALRCKGDSMINDRIFDGDIVYIRQQPDVENGEIAAVLIDNEATLKRVYKYPHRIELRAANPTIQPFEYSEDEMKTVRILGKAVAFTSIIR